MKLINIFKKKKVERHIVERTNTIQYDCMGYPLRLVKMSDGRYQWLDSYEEDGDIALNGDEVLKLNKKLFD